MIFPNWQLNPELVFCSAVVLPVLVIHQPEDALPLVSALFAGGMKVIEVTLRTPKALQVIQLLSDALPEALIGAGTVTTPAELNAATLAGAKFAFSPGITSALLEAGRSAAIPLIPGVASASELMEGLALGYTHFKFFPAAAAGGVSFLKAMQSPFPKAKFCPTGGIDADNFRDYLALPNVPCVGGSWIVPKKAIENKDWSLISALALSVNRQSRLEQI